MKACIQRVQGASCVVDGRTVSSTGHGYMILVGFTHTDSIENASKMAKKIASLRVFSDQEGKMNLSIKDVGGEILCISQFTMYADCLKGNRPSFVDSMEPIKANELYLSLIKELNDTYLIKTLPGVFGAHMELHPICDGPVTIILEN